MAHSLNQLAGAFFPCILGRHKKHKYDVISLITTFIDGKENLPSEKTATVELHKS